MLRAERSAATLRFARNTGGEASKVRVSELITDYARRGSRRISYAIIARILLRHAIRLRGMSAHPRMRTMQFLKEAVAQEAASYQAAKVRDRSVLHCNSHVQD